MIRRRSIVVLDSLFDDLSLEADAAMSRGWVLERANGDGKALARAAIAVHVRTRVDSLLLDQMPACRVVGRFGTGLDTVDREAVAARGIRVVSVRDYCIPELTSHTLGLAFALSRRIDAVKDGRLDPETSWQKVAAEWPIPGRTSATVVGFGAIGSAMTRALLALGFSVRVVTEHGWESARRLGAEPVTVGEGFRDAGYVFLHAALTPETARLVDRPLIAEMSATTILVNTARLGLFDEAAVAEAIRARSLAGVAIDAQLGLDSPLREHLSNPMLLLTPHIGWYSERSATTLRRRTILDSIDAADTDDDVRVLATSDREQEKTNVDKR